MADYMYSLPQLYKMLTDTLGTGDIPRMVELAKQISSVSNVSADSAIQRAVLDASGHNASIKSHYRYLAEARKRAREADLSEAVREYEFGRRARELEAQMAGTSDTSLVAPDTQLEQALTQLEAPELASVTSPATEASSTPASRGIVPVGNVQTMREATPIVGYSHAQSPFGSMVSDRRKVWQVDQDTAANPERVYNMAIPNPKSLNAAAPAPVPMPPQADANGQFGFDIGSVAPPSPTFGKAGTPTSDIAVEDGAIPASKGRLPSGNAGAHNARRLAKSKGGKSLLSAGTVQAPVDFDRSLAQALSRASTSQSSFERPVSTQFGDQISLEGLTQSPTIPTNFSTEQPSPLATELGVSDAVAPEVLSAAGLSPQDVTERELAALQAESAPSDPVQAAPSAQASLGAHIKRGRPHTIREPVTEQDLTAQLTQASLENQPAEALVDELTAAGTGAPGTPGAFAYDTKSGVSLGGKNVGKWMGGIGIGMNAVGALGELDKMSKEGDRTGDLSNDVINASLASPMATYNLTPDQLKLLGEVRAGRVKNNVDAGDFDMSGMLSGALSGGLTGLTGGIPMAIAGAVAGGAKGGLAGLTQAKARKNAELEALYQALNQSNADYRARMQRHIDSSF